MKNPNPSWLLALLLFSTIFSCSKKDETPQVPPAVLPDTLTIGCTKQNIGGKTDAAHGWACGDNGVILRFNS